MFVFCCCFSRSVILKSVVTKEVIILHSSQAILTIIQRKGHYAVCKSSDCTISFIHLASKLIPCPRYVPMGNGLLLHSQALLGLVFLMYETQEVVEIMIILYSIWNMIWNQFDV